MRKVFVGFFVVVFLLGSSACKGDGTGGEEVFTPDPEIYAVPVADDAIVLVATESGDATFAFPNNQLLLFSEEGTQRADADAAALQIGGTVVGQIPDLGIYQVEISSASVEELFEAMASLEQEAGVEGVAVNFLSSFPYAATTETASGLATPNRDFRDFDPTRCPSMTDNSNLTDAKKAPYALVEYEIGLSILDHVRDQITLEKVKTGIIDDAFGLLYPQFSTLKSNQRYTTAYPSVEILTSPVGSSVGHGNRVLAILGADDDSATTNGVALAFLQDKLHVVLGHADGTDDGNRLCNGTSGMGTLTATSQAIRARSKVINLSFGFFYSRAMVEGQQPGTTVDPAREATLRENLKQLHYKWKRLFMAHPDVVFVAAAPNGIETSDGTCTFSGSMEKGDEAYSPAGIDLDNVITVGGVETHFDGNTGQYEGVVPSCGFDGGAIDLYAPFDVPHVDGSTIKGTSFAAPLVTSAVAMMLSVDPSLSPALVKVHLMNSVSIQPSGVRVLSLARSLNQVVYNRYCPEGGGGPELCDYFAFDRSEVDLPGTVYGRYCEEHHLQVGAKSYVLPPPSEGMAGSLGTVDFENQRFQVGTNGTDFFTNLRCWFPQGEFHLGKYRLVSGEVGTGGDCWFTLTDIDSMGAAASLSGTASFGLCKVVQSAFGNPSQILLEVEMSGTVEYVDSRTDPPEVDTRALSGRQEATLILPPVLESNAELDAFFRQVKDACGD